jgi:RNA polymerase sigma factor (sigma-70 family)
MSSVYSPESSGESGIRNPFETGVHVTHENPVALRAAASLTAYLERSVDSARLAALPHQQAILNDVLQGLYDGMQRGYVESPTATGKTYLMCRLAEAFYDAEMRVLILCDRQHQADQILGKVGDTGLIQATDYMDLRDIGTHYEGAHASSTDRVVISTYASLNNFSQSGELGEFDVVLADEAHRSLGPITSKNLINFCPAAIKAGFTATPAYSVDKRISEIFDHPFHSTSLKEAIENDLVAPMTCLIYASDAEIPYLYNSEEYSQKELDKLISLKPRNDKAIEFTKDFIADGRQGIIACVPGSNLAHARMLASELDGDFIKLADGRLKFIRAKAVGSFLSPAENQTILEEYEYGQVDVLTFVDMISEGWNSRVASFLIDLQPTSSELKKKQKMGRVIRKKPDNLLTIIVDFMDISRKAQVTALDILRERHIVLGRRFGARSSNGSGGGSSFREDRVQIDKLLNSSLWLELQQINMSRIADLRLRSASSEPSVRDPIVAKYETMLGKGLPREPYNSMEIPAVAITEIGIFMRRYAKNERMLPDREAIEEYINDKMTTQEEWAPLLAQLALQGFDAEPAGILRGDPRVADEYELENEVLYNERMATINKCLAALPDREKEIIELRFGFHDGKQHTFESIGHQLDITRERVRQLEGQALGRLSALRELWSII